MKSIIKKKTLEKWNNLELSKNDIFYMRNEEKSIWKSKLLDFAINSIFLIEINARIAEHNRSSYIKSYVRLLIFTFFDKSYVAFLFRLIKISRLDLDDHEKLFKAIQINHRIAWYI